MVTDQADPASMIGELSGRRTPTPPGPLDVVIYSFCALVIVMLACGGGFGVGYLFSHLLHR